MVIVILVYLLSMFLHFKTFDESLNILPLHELLHNIKLFESFTEIESKQQLKCINIIVEFQLLKKQNY
jgi:hypothetical protein